MIVKRFHIILFFGIVLAGCGLWYFAWKPQQFDSSFCIRDFDYSRDHQAVEDLFNKGDNFYWMVAMEGGGSYSIDFMLRNKTSSQFETKRDLVMKVATIDGKLAGFMAYHPLSGRVWKLLFLIVDQDFRRQGVAKKILKYSVDDMMSRNALRIDLGTRNNNFKAQNLYKNFGFKYIDADDESHFVHFSLYK